MLKLFDLPKERTINDLRGGPGKSGKKKLNGYLPGEKNSAQQPGRKKTQLNNLEEKKVQLNNLEEKKS